MFYKDCPGTSAHPDVFDLIRNTFVFFIRISNQLYDAFISLNHWNGEEKILEFVCLFVIVLNGQVPKTIHWVHISKPK